MKRTYLQNIIILIGLAFEVSILPIWLITEAIAYSICLHFFAITLLGLGLYLYERLQSRKDRLRAVRLYCFFLIIFFPVLGLFFSGIVYFLVRFSQRNFKTHLEEIDDEIGRESGDREVTGRSSINIQKKFHQEVSFESFVDIMADAHVTVKAKAIEKLSQRLNQDSIKLLKKAVRDPIADIRLYASGVLLRIENQFNKKIQKAVLTSRTQGSAKSFSHLAGLYWDYATIGILDHVLSKYYLGLSIEAYRMALKLDGEQSRTVVQYTRCLIELKEFDKARIAVEGALKKWPENADIIFLRGEIDFKSARFKRIPTHFRSIHEPDGLSEEQKQILEFWTTKN